MIGSNPLLDVNARLVIAHRGNRAFTAENTLESLRQAVELGADAIEFDVRLTRDGVPVVIHDSSVDRTTDGAGPVSAFTFEELQSLDAAAGRGSRSPEPLRIPSLEQVLDAFRYTPLVIEIKELDAAAPAERLLHRFGAQNRVVVGSADAAVAEWLYRSGLPSCAAPRDAARWLPRALARSSPTRPPEFRVLSITPTFRGLPIPVIGMASVGRAVGVPTHVWTINDSDVARRYWRGGVAGIVTDDPAMMLRARNR